jgi:TPR repeat protein
MTANPFIAYEGGDPYIFISYAHADSERVFPIISEFHNRGFPVWYDQGIEMGEKWRKDLVSHIKKCTVFVLFLSPSSVISENVIKEVSIAASNKKNIVPVDLEDVLLPEELEYDLSSIQHVKFGDKELFYSKCSRMFEKWGIKASHALSPSPKSAVTGASKDPAPVPSGDVEALVIQGDAAYEAKDFAKAVECWSKAAKAGNAEAQSNLGKAYYYGEGVPQDKGKAAEWGAKAAAQDYAKGQNFLGFCYSNGEGVPQDKAKAVEWYAKAAAQGYAGAQYNLGFCYGSGEGVPQDKAKAVEWYAKAAAQGYVMAQNNLGLAYENGDGVPLDKGKAVEWYAIAAAQGNAEAQYNLGLAYADGEGVPEDIAKAVEWLKKAAAQGHPYAKAALEELDDHW